LPGVIDQYKHYIKFEIFTPQTKSGLFKNVEHLAFPYTKEARLVVVPILFAPSETHGHETLHAWLIARKTAMFEINEHSDINLPL